MRKPSEDWRLHNIVWLEPDDFEYLCFDFTREQMSFDEPIPDYSTRNNDLLESALGSPKQTFAGQFLYPTLIEQASILFYSIIKNHPFKNGNKRIAVMSLLVFLALNNRWLSISPHNLYKLAVLIAGTDPQLKDKVLAKIKKNVRKYLIAFPGQ
ncbi:type II toxin-antitoxin system death-on-curing family toxin [Patescibacteria group bacterium]|nr:type II toxin-antitoxin system death-on-curing family toxin [Patescibacteria group bacterium]MCL5091940.1 type II toxin-antitoxin system death-on-curing family toxin [Patescibacteria group bacterium]